MRGLQAVLLGCVLMPAEVFALGTEEFGNEPLQEWLSSPLAAIANHESRVYHSWVNGAEDFYYKGDVTTLNAFLKQFAEGTTSEGTTSEGQITGEVILRPLPGKTQSFYEKPVEYDWHMEIYGGIAERMTKEDRGVNIWRPHPTVTIAVAEAALLASLAIPEGLAVTSPAEVKARYAEALGSSDQTVRGWGAGKLSRFDPYDATSMAIVAGLLGDKEDWVRLNAAGSLQRFGAMAKPLVPLLGHTAAGKTGAGDVGERIAETVKVIEGSEVDADAVRRYREAMAAIEGYLEKRSG